MNLAHPSTFVSSSVLNEIRKYAEEAESLRDLHPRQLDIILKEKWFKMFVPKEFGGSALSIIEVLRIEEGLAWADGSTAWVTTLCSGAGWFVGFLDSSLTQKIFHDNNLCVAGSGNVSGTAEIIKEGYRINGLWKYASGSLHATLFTANCAIIENGIPKLDAIGKPVVRAFAFFPDEVKVIRSWNMMGMIATASHSFSITNIIVPSTRAFVIDSQHARIANPVYRYPFLQLAETTLTINLSGMTQRFLDLCHERFANNVNQIGALNAASDKLGTARTSVYDAVEASWKVCESGGDIPPALLSDVSATCRSLSRTCISLVDRLYPHTGLGAADISTEINRVWRNFHTAAQHSLFSRE